MPPTATHSASIEDRLAALEEAVAELTRRLEQPEFDPDWIQKTSGMMKDLPEFDRVIEYGRQWRESQPYADEDAAEC